MYTEIHAKYCVQKIAIVYAKRSSFVNVTGNYLLYHSVYNTGSLVIVVHLTLTKNIIFAIHVCSS